MKKILIILLACMSLACNAQLIRTVRYKGMSPFFWKIKTFEVCEDRKTTNFELWLYFNMASYKNDKEENQLNIYQSVTIDSVIREDTSEAVYNLIKEKSPFFASAIVATAMESNAIEVEQDISDSVSGADTIKRVARLTSCIQDIKGKTVTTGLSIDFYKNGTLVNTSLIDMVIDDLFEFDGSGISEYEYFTNSLLSASGTYNERVATIIRGGIQYADAYGIINAKLRGER